MSKLKFLYLILIIYTFSNCYRPRRVEPSYPSSSPYSTPFLSSISHQNISGTDSNKNGENSSFSFNVQLGFKNRGVFSYEISYNLEDYNYSKNVWITRNNILVDESLKFSENIFINADSILKINKISSSSIKLYINLKNEYGNTIEIPVSGSTSTFSFLVASNFIETKDKDRKVYINNFYSNIGNNISSSDKNKNSFLQLPSTILISFSINPPKINSYYALIKYRAYSSYQDKYVAFAETKEFQVNDDRDFKSAIIPLTYLIDTNEFKKENYDFSVELYDSKNKELLGTSYTSSRLEKYSDDNRTFDLEKFELKDSTDRDKDSFSSIYNAILRISSSDKTSKKYIVKILYSIYGKDSYDQLVPLVLNCDQENNVLITGGSLLPKGFYDLKIDLYDYNSVTNTSEGLPIRSWQALDSKILQAIAIEKIAEDTP